MGRKKLTLKEMTEQRNFYKKQATQLHEAVEETEKILDEATMKNNILTQDNKHLESRVNNIHFDYREEIDQLYDDLKLQTKISTELSRRILELDGQVKNLLSRGRNLVSHSINECSGTKEETGEKFKPEIPAGKVLQERRKSKVKK